jgi:hypothetical protein
MKLVDNKGYINPHKLFTYQNKLLMVIGTSANEHPNTPTYRHSVWLAIDLIKNLETGKVTEVSRKKLFELNIEL